MSKGSSINLLNTSHTSFFERFINWTLTIGRVVIIVTELVALGAFLYRFSLDQQLIDLHSKIKQEQAIVSYLKDSEESYRNLQDRLSIASKFSAVGQNRVNLFNDIISLTPVGINFSQFSLNNDKIRIDAEVNSISALSSFVDSIKTYKLVDKVIINKIENKASTGTISVTIVANLKESKYANKN